MREWFGVLKQRQRRQLVVGEAVGRLGHTLKGMISNFASPAAQASAFEVEQIGKSGDLSAVGPALATLEARLNGLIADLTDFLATRA